MIPFRSIRAKLLAIFIVAAVLPIGVLSLVSYFNSLKAVEQMVGNRTERIASSVLDDLDLKLGRRIHDDLLVRNDPVQNYLQSLSADAGTRQTALTRLSNYIPGVFDQYGTFYDDITLADANGNPVFKYDRREGLTTPGPLAATALAHAAPIAVHSEQPDLPPAPQPDSSMSSRNLNRVIVRVPPGDSADTGTRFVFESSTIDWSKAAELDSEAMRKIIKEAMVEARGNRREKQQALEKLLEAQGIARDRELDETTRRTLADVSTAIKELRVFFPNTPDPPAPPAFRTPRPMIPWPAFSDGDRRAARVASGLEGDDYRVLVERTSADQPPAVSIARPIYARDDPGRRLGSLVAHVRPDHLFPDDLASRSFGEKGELMVVNTDTGELLYHSRAGLSGRDLSLVDDALFRTMDRTHSGSQTPWVSVPGPDGARLASVRQVEGVPWKIVAVSSPREFEHEARRAGVLNLFVSCLGLLLAAGVLVVASDRISKSVNVVTAGARNIAEGDLENPIRVSTHDEIQTLAETFNTMRESLRESIALRERAAAELDALNRTLEDRVHQRTKELESLNDALNDANTELKELDRLKSNFLATVSHEFKTPLTSIKAFSEILLDEAEAKDSGDETRRFLKIINSESDRLGRLIKNLLDLSRIESRRMVWRKSLFPVRRVVDSAVDGLLPLFNEKGLRLERSLVCGDARVYADEDRIQEVLTNVLHNAAKVSDPGKAIRIRCAEESVDGNGTRIVNMTIEDEGPGIQEGQLEKVFDRFSQVDSSKSRVKGGTGLGLAISREIVEHHGGRIWAESESGRGATFHITLPLAVNGGDGGASHDGPPTGDEGEEHG